MEEKKLGLHSLGTLEIDVMTLMWEKEEATVKDIFEVLYERRRLAYTTIMTVMHRLARKGILGQDKKEIPYVYWPLVSREHYSEAVIKEIISKVLNNDARPVYDVLLKKRKPKSDELTYAKQLLKV